MNATLNKIAARYGKSGRPNNPNAQMVHVPRKDVSRDVAPPSKGGGWSSKKKVGAGLAVAGTVTAAGLLARHIKNRKAKNNEEI